MLILSIGEDKNHSYHSAKKEVGKMRMLKKEGMSNIRGLILFGLAMVITIIYGVALFAIPAGVESGGRQVNITNVSDSNSNYLVKMNSTEYLSNTSFTVTILLNKTASTDTSIELYYDVGQTPDGTANSDCKVDTNEAGQGMGPWTYTITAGGAASKCRITDGSVVAMLVQVDGINYPVEYTGAAANDTWNFTVDGAVPTLSSILIPESDDTWKTNMSLIINGSDSTSTSLSYKLYINGTSNVTGTNITVGGVGTGIGLTGLMEGKYYSVLVEVSDSVSNKLNSSARTFYYDATAPTTATTIGITNDTYLSSMTININVTDGGDRPLRYFVYLNGSSNASGVATSGASTPVALTGLTDGQSYAIGIAALDNASNTINATVSTVFYDGTGITYSNILIPATNNTWKSNMTIGFNASDVGDSSLSYKLFINNTINVTGSNLTITTALQQDGLTGLMEGKYYSVVFEAADSASHSLNSSPTTLWYDATAPTMASTIGITNGSYRSSMSININVTDGAGQPLVYYVYVNGSMNKTETNGTNGGSTPVTLTGLTDGQYYSIGVAAVDNASNVLNATTAEFFYDGAAPTYANILSPETNNTWKTNMSIAFNASDAVDLSLSYKLFANNPINASGSNITVPTVIQWDGLTGLMEGKYYSVVFEAADSASHSLNSSPVTFWYDSTVPTQASTIGITNDTYVSSMSININVTDGAGQPLTYYVYVNDSYNATGIASNGVSTAVNLTGLTDGQYYAIGVAAVDNASNVLNQTTARFFYDGTGITYSNILIPATNNTWKSNMTIGFNASDTVSAVLSYRFFVNGTLNISGANLTITTAIQYDDLTGLMEGKYYSLIFEAADNSSHALNSSPTTLWYDGTAPTVATTLGIVNGTYSSTAVTINVSDGAGQPLRYYVYVNGSINASGIASNNGASTAVTIGGLTDGKYYNITVAAVDNASNVLNATTALFTYDASVPSYSNILSPSSNNSDVSSMVIGFNASDGVSTTLNYKFYVNGTGNVTGTNLSTSLALQHFPLTGLVDGGYYELILEVSDNSSNKLNSSPRTFYYDGTGPQISAINGTNTSSRVVSFYVIDAVRSVNLSSIVLTGMSKVTPIFNATRYCNLLTNGSNGYYCQYIENGFEPGTSVLNITAKDNASNSASNYVYSTKATSAGFKYNVSLASGWNLVSTPLILENSSIDNAIANNSEINSLYYYDGSSWSSWFSTAPDTITTMEPLKGYWVYTSSATTLNLFGNKTSGTPSLGYGFSNPRSLSANSWYLIGHYMSNFSASSYNTDATLSAMCTGGLCSGQSTLKFNVLQYYNSATSELTPLLKTDYGSDASWTRGRGFWIYMNSAHTLQGTPS